MLVWDAANKKKKRNFFFKQGNLKIGINMKVHVELEISQEYFQEFHGQSIS